jgi:hypothetical protein
MTYDPTKSAAHQNGADFDMDRARAEFLANQDREQQAALAAVPSGPLGTYAQYVASKGSNPLENLASEAQWGNAQKAGNLAAQQGALSKLSTSYSAQNTPLAQGLRDQMGVLNTQALAQGTADQAADAQRMRTQWGQMHPAGQTGYSSVSEANRPSWGRAVGSYAEGGSVTDPALVGRIRQAFNTQGLTAARTLATQLGIPATQSIEPYTTGTNTGNPAYGAVDPDMVMDRGWTGNVDGSSLPVAASRLYDPANVDHKVLIQQLAKGLQDMIAGGQEDQARTIYNEKKGLYGFTDDEFGPYTAGMGSLGAAGATGSQVTNWAGATPSAVIDPIVAPVTKLPVDDGSGQKVVNQTDNRSTNGDQTVRDMTTGGVNSPGVIGNQNVTGNDVTGSGNILGNNNISGSYNTTDNRNYQGWGTGGGAAAPAFNTPTLDALYAAQTNRLQGTAPSFNFQGGAKPPGMRRGGKIQGPLSLTKGRKC